MNRCALQGFLFFSLLFGGGCDQDMELPCSDRVCVDAVIVDGESRTAMTGSKASFISGDKIGLFEILTGQSNLSYTYNGTVWSATMPAYWRNATSTHTFCAYYPYNSNYSGTKVSIPVLSTQLIGTTPNPAMDLLVAGTLSQTRSAAVGLKFTHAFSLIQLNVKMGLLNLLNPYDLNAITIRGGNPSGSGARYGIVNTTGTASDIGYNLLTGVLQADLNTSSRYAQSFTTNVNGVQLLDTFVTLYLFVLPGTYSNPLPSISFKVSLLGVISTSTTANFSNTTFEAGMKYVYDVSIGRLIYAPGAEVMLVSQAVVPINIQPFNIQ